MVTYPLYLMLVDGDRRWMSLREAGITFDSGWVKVEIGGWVRDTETTERPITQEERNRISEIADEWSSSK